MDKKRVLFVGESSTSLNTGFSTLSLGMLERLYKTGKFELAELATYSETGDPKHFSVPWKIYPGVPHPSNKAATAFYHSNYIGQFGAAVFDDVVLDFQPDIVVSFMDPFMVSYIQDSPFRDKFKFLLMACVDSQPQKSEWLDFYSKVDKIIGYARYTKEVLEEESSGKIKVDELVRPGVNHEIFKPMDRSECRKRMGVPLDCNLIMKIARNQKRKLFPDIIDVFRDYLKKYEDPNTYFYIHTSFPDVGYDIGRHIMQSGVSHRILTTYKCAACQYCYSDFFQSELTVCKRCNNLAAHMPNTSNGVSREELAVIHNCADLYIQYAICEGLGMPICEAKACGIPVYAVDYSAMSEQVEIEGCEKLKVQRLWGESVIETEQVRALPDNAYCVEKIRDFFQSTPEQRKKWSELARKDAVENYSFDRAAKVFEKAIDELECFDCQLNWHHPKPSFPPMRKDLPENCSNEHFVDWCIDNILGKPELKSSYFKTSILKDLTVGYSSTKGGRNKFERMDCANLFMDRAMNKFLWEKKRIEKISPKNEDSIKWKLI